MKITCRDRPISVKVNKCACASICARLLYGRLRLTFTEVKTKTKINFTEVRLYLTNVQIAIYMPNIINYASHAILNA